MDFLTDCSGLTWLSLTRKYGSIANTLKNMPDVQLQLNDGSLYVQSKAMKLLKKQRVMDGVDAWGPMAYADGMLVLRDAHTVKCLKIVWSSK